MDAIEAAVLRTVLYADVFKFPLTSREIHHFLINDEPVTYADIEKTLNTSSILKQHLRQAHGYYVRAGHEDTIEVRRAREQASEQLIPLALRYAAWLSHLPFVRMVALTGALSMRNAVENDDLDYLLVTVPGRVWLARAAAIVMVRLVRLRGTEICPNYVLDENALAQSRQDVFIAHEITQMVPLFGHDLYQQMRAANGWVDYHLPNASATFYEARAQTLNPVWKWLKASVEFVLGGALGDAFERWEYQRKLRRFAPKMRQPDSAAQIDASHVKGHFEDHGTRAIREYRERLRLYGLDEEGVFKLQAGD
ncbi:MAG: hypothetical protein U0694_28655 [Anaerolineae bacterium]